MIPVYGFLQGDVIGVLVLAYESDTVFTIGEKLKSAASVRVAHRSGGVVLHKGEKLDPAKRVSQIKLEALDRIDLVWEPV